MSKSGLEDLSLDGDLKEELEDTQTEDLITEYGAAGDDSTGKTIGFAEKWFPDENEWQGKTRITAQQAQHLAMVRHLPQIFEEIEELSPFLEGFITDFEMYLTSIDGESRKEHLRILTSMFGGSTEFDDAAKSAALQLFAQSDTEED